MLERVLEPEAMDSAEEAAEYDAMDHSEVNARFVADFLAAHGPCRGGLIFDLGTGTARIPIALAEADANARVEAIDLSPPMLELGRRNIEQAGLADRVALELADAKRIGHPDGAFEAVMSNSIIHHIPQPAGVLAEILRVTAPGGTVFVRDLARPDSKEEISRLVLTYTRDETPHARDLFEASLHAALNLEEIRDLVASIGAPAESISMTSDRHWTWSWRRTAT